MNSSTQLENIKLCIWYVTTSTSIYYTQLLHVIYGYVLHLQYCTIKQYFISVVFLAKPDETFYYVSQNWVIHVVYTYQKHLPIIRSNYHWGNFRILLVESNDVIVVTSKEEIEKVEAEHDKATDENNGDTTFQFQL